MKAFSAPEDSANLEPVSNAKNGESFLDLASPAEVAEELGLTETPSAEAPEAAALAPQSLRSQNDLAQLDLTQYFPVVVLVNKAASGPTAQTVKVFHRGQLAYEFAASTGRETPENAKSGRQYFSTTPTGWFAPTRTFEKYYSNTWLAWMNNSVFFTGGIALHATTPEHFKELGHRASGGCVRLHPKNAKLLYDLVLAEGQGNVPAFSSQGKILRGVFGGVKFHQGWNTIIVVEDNPGY